MRPTQSASQQQTTSDDLQGNQLEESVNREEKGSGLDNGEPLSPAVLKVITDEVLRHRIRTIMEEKPKPSRWQRFSTHPVGLMVVGFFLSVFLGGLLTNYYTLKQKDLEHQRNIQQQELARQRSFSDELNKIRIQKIGEVWEHIDKTEIILDGLLDKANKASSSNQKEFDDIISVIREDISIINKNRFWLGEQTYNRIREYMDINGRYALDMLLGPEGIDLSETIRKRQQAKQDILQIRKMFLEGESESIKRPTGVDQ